MGRTALKLTETGVLQMCVERAPEFRPAGGADPSDAPELGASACLLLSSSFFVPPWLPRADSRPLLLFAQTCSSSLLRGPSSQHLGPVQPKPRASQGDDGLLWLRLAQALEVDSHGFCSGFSQWNLAEQLGQSVTALCASVSSSVQRR